MQASADQMVSLPVIKISMVRMETHPSSNGSEFTSAATLYPDAEDINRENTMNAVGRIFPVHR
jgi:hypothetical protein